MLNYKRIAGLTALVILLALLAACGDNTPTTAIITTSEYIPSTRSNTVGANTATPAISTTATTPAATGTTTTAATTGAAAAPRTVTKPTADQLRIAIAVDESTLTPFSYVTGYPGQNLLSLVYDSLYIFDPNFQPKPWLATGFKVSPDGKQYTVSLRDKVQWQDGKPLVAEDVKMTYELMQKAPGNAWAAGVNGIASIEAPDPQTVIFNLKTANPEFVLRPLAVTPILPKHIWGAVKPEEAKTFTGGKVGSGPYKLVDYQAETLYRFQANPTYWAGKPTVNELIMPVIKDPNTIFSSLRSNQIDSSTRALPPELIKDFESSSQTRLLRGPSFGSTMLQFNASKAPFNQLEVRQAISYAIDNQKLIDTVLLGNALPGNPGFTHPESPFHNPDVKPLTYNPAKAKELLDKLGYLPGPDGIRVANGQPMDFKLLVQSNNPVRVRSAELIRDWLKEIGLKITVQSLDQNSVTALVWPDFDVKKGRNFDLSMWGWSATTQQSLSSLATLYHSNTDLGTLNIGGIKSPKLDSLVEELNATTDLQKRTEVGKRLEVAAAEELPFDTLFYENSAYAFRPGSYDGYVYHKIWGIISKFSFLPTGQ